MHRNDEYLLDARVDITDKLKLIVESGSDRANRIPENYALRDLPRLHRYLYRVTNESDDSLAARPRLRLDSDERMICYARNELNVVTQMLLRGNSQTIKYFVRSVYVPADAK